MARRTSRVALVSWLMSLALIVSVAPAARAVSFSEVGDAPELAGQAAGTLPALTRITGNIGSGTDADMFIITLATGGLFSATTLGTGGSLVDTQLFLFNSSGHGLLANDDSGGTLRSTLPPTALAAGNYLLAISAWDRDPVSAGGLIFPTSPFSNVFGPTGPGGAGAITGWDGSGGTGDYAIDLELQPVPEPATLFLFGSALAGIGMARRRFRKQS